MTALPISVITCTRNPRPNYLRRLVDSLAIQSLDRALWEYVIVDNGSSDPAAVAAEASRIGGRVVVESQVGLTAARLKGISSTSGSVLVFFDDDNVPQPSYLEHVAEIASAHPFIGSWGGSVSGEFEIPVPLWMSKRLRILAVREVSRDMWSNLPGVADSMPLGAGLCVRRDVAEHYVRLHEQGSRPIMLDRTGTSLLSGGDEDLAACAAQIGLGLGVFEKLRMTHIIPRDRFDLDYVVRLEYGIAYSAVIRKWYHGESYNPRPRAIPSRIAELIRMALREPHERAIRKAEARGRAQGIADITKLSRQSGRENKRASQAE